ncbi:MAG TPA: agmatine deiminase family protein [Thiothrix sp.]|nr:agmatine deiminase family protein [Thiothrix sp.]
MLTWVHDTTDWHDYLQTAERCYCDLATTILRYEALLIICRDHTHQQHIHQQLIAHKALTKQELARLHFCHSDYNDTWVRDYGFITVFEQMATGTTSTCLLDFQFNAWGNKFVAEADNQVNRQLQQHPLFADCTMQHYPWVLEGGSIDSDGQGTLLTTTQCLLNPNRNPLFDQATIEQHLQQTLGAERILWLKHGYIAGDDTDAHIDTLARFASTERIVYVAATHADLPQMAAELQALRQQNGQPYELYPVPLPIIEALDDQGKPRQLPASYVNFLIINQAVLVPTYDVPEDAIALAQIQRAFPHHTIMPINCRVLIEQNGSLHCVTMQIPDNKTFKQINQSYFLENT